MIRSRRNKWVSGMGVAVLVGGLVLANYGGGVTPAGADNEHRGNPLRQILVKLDKILAAIAGLGGGGEGNHTLRWDTNNPSASRFVTAFPGAVLDKNTGLVWEQAPAPDATGHAWFFATGFCVERNVGGTVGWRLPSVVELKSVQDPTLPAPFVPASVFTGVQSANYWSATTYADDPTRAWIVLFFNGGVGDANKASSFPVWCVRGGMNADVY